MGIPARINPVNGTVQIAANTSESSADISWNDVLFGATSNENAPKATLRLTYETQGILSDPAYYSHFTLSRIIKGRPSLQEYDEGNTTLHSTFAQGTQVDAGHYILTSGTRLANGGVLAHVELFPIAANANATLPLTMRQSTDALQVIGSFNSESLYLDASGTERSLLSTTGRGYYVVGLIRPNHEPSNHALRDLANAASQLQSWDRSIILLFVNEEDMQQFRIEDFAGLPANLTFGVARGNMLDELRNQQLIQGSELPVILMADTFNRVVWIRQGYTIGHGEQILQVIGKL